MPIINEQPLIPEPGVAVGVPRELLEFLLATGVAEYHLVSGSRRDRSELGAAGES